MYSWARLQVSLWVIISTSSSRYCTYASSSPLHFFFQMLEESLHLSSKYLAQEAKVKSTVSRVVTLEVENSKLKKDLITTMDETNLSKEKAKTLSDDLKAKRQLTMEKDKQLLAAKEKIKTITVEAVKDFQ